VLATQNPVDLDYKALSNAGTWFIGRLQTARDQQRVLDGLEGAQAGAGARFDRRQIAQTLAGLSSRVFLMNNVHEDQPVLFESRWAMSYLRGPLTRDQIKRLMEPLKPSPAAASAVGQAQEPAAHPASQPAAARASSGSGGTRPPISPAVSQFFLPRRSTPREAQTLVYEAGCLAMAKIYYADAKVGLSAEQEISVLAEISPELNRPLWEEAVLTEVRERDLQTVPEPQAQFSPVSPALEEPKNYLEWTKDFREWLYRSQSLRLFRSPSLDLVSGPGESEKDFRIRLQQTGRERRDELLERLRQRYAARIFSLQERIRRAAQAVEREKEQARQQKLQTAISVGVTLMDVFIGRKGFRRTSLGRATTAARGAGRILKEGQDVQRAAENLQALQQQLAELEAQVEQETEALKTTVDPLTEELERLEVRPRKTDISVRVFGLGWVPHWRDARGGLAPAF